MTILLIAYFWINAFLTGIIAAEFHDTSLSKFIRTMIFIIYFLFGTLFALTIFLNNLIYYIWVTPVEYYYAYYITGKYKNMSGKSLDRIRINYLQIEPNSMTNDRKIAGLKFVLNRHFYYIPGKIEFNERLRVYKAIRRLLRQGNKSGFCMLLFEFGYNLYSFPELLEYEPEDNQYTYWFPRKDIEPRIEILDKIISEMNFIQNNKT